MFSFDIFIKDDFSFLPIYKTCCLGLIERKPETDNSRYRKNIRRTVKSEMKDIRYRRKDRTSIKKNGKRNLF